MNDTEAGSEGGGRSTSLGARAAKFIRLGLEALADAALPPVCLGCREPLAAHDALCSGCWSSIAFIRPPLCDRTGLPMPFSTGATTISAAALAQPPDYDRARAVAVFDGLMRRLVHDLKYRDRHDGRRLFGRWLCDAGQELIGSAHVVVPVPLGRRRLLGRRYNQAAVLAQEIARKTGLDYAPLVLVRRRATPPQVGLTRRQRADNVRRAFAVPPARAADIAGRNVLLVDDVVTTGATVGACARALKRAGAARVDVLALALVADVALVPG